MNRLARTCAVAGQLANGLERRSAVYGPTTPTCESRTPNLQHCHVSVNADIHEIGTMFVEEDDKRVADLRIDYSGSFPAGLSF